MKRTFLLTAAILAALSAAAQWQPAGDRIKTVWGENLDPQNVLPEYPRPQLVRGEWQNLNGLWNYAIRPLGETPEEFDGEILVPFAAESALSGVGRCPGAANGLWYERTFSVPGKWHGKRVLLHFGAVDWKTDVWVNGIAVGSHTGGFTPFAFDITEALAKNGNTLRVRVWDPTEKSYQPRGKQSDRPEGIWYSSVSGIWQTVWLEAVPQRYIREVRTTPDLDRKRFLVEAPLSEAVPGDLVEVALYDGETQVAAGRALNGAPVELSVAEPKLWSPDTPFLYDLKVTLRHDGRIVDQVRSYTAMRKFSTGRDRHNVPRLMLNDKPLFQFGPLDQGWWPDGLYTAPTDEALAYDVVKTKELGYNMIRKHVKVEPARWYYHCDKAGIIVWQDMPSGDITPGSPRWQMNRYFTGEEKRRSPESKPATARSGARSSTASVRSSRSACGFPSTRRGASSRRPKSPRGPRPTTRRASWTPPAAATTTGRATCSTSTTTPCPRCCSSTPTAYRCWANSAASARSSKATSGRRTATGATYASTRRAK